MLFGSVTSAETASGGGAGGCARGLRGGVTGAVEAGPVATGGWTSGGAARVRVEKDQAEPLSVLAWAAHAEGAVRNTAQCASTTTVLSTTSRQEGRRRGAGWGSWGMSVVGKRRRRNAGLAKGCARGAGILPRASLIQSDNSPP